MQRRFHPVKLLSIACLSLVAAGVAASDGPGAVRRVYSHLIEPREHPDDDRRAVRPPSWRTFRNRTQFTSLRRFSVQDGHLLGIAEELEKYSRTHELGDVIWPSYQVLFARNLGDLADEIRQRDLYLFDIWGYVPGSGPGGYWWQFQPPREALATLEAKLGERWLGTDFGEQDGRYVGGFANQMTPASAGRFEQYLNFQRHAERMGDDLGHRVRQRFDLQPLGLQGLRTGRRRRRRPPRPGARHQPEPDEAATLLAHPLQLRRRGLRGGLVRGGRPLAHRPHPTGRQPLGR